MKPAPRLLPVVLVTVLAAGPARAQGVAINGTGAPADTSAILDLASTSKGLLPPRMTGLQRGAIVLPASGLVVYQTDGVQGLYWNAGTPGAPNWKQVGESGAGASQWVTNGSNIHYSAGNVGIQRSAPLARLDVLGGNWDVVNGEGDLRIGDGVTRLKIGIATGGGGTGAATIMEQGPVGAYNVLSLGTQGNKVLHVNGATQRVGIGTDAPKAPLGFPATLGKKITLYSGGTNDYGFGISGGRLQVYSDSPVSDVAIGYDTGGAFTERFAFKGSGALAVNGNTGSAGQVLQSNGSGAAASWVNPTSAQYGGLYNTSSNSSVLVTDFATPVVLPGLTQTFSVSGNARVLVSFVVLVRPQPCFACGSSTAIVDLNLNGGLVNRFNQDVPNGGSGMLSPVWVLDVGPGTHTVDVRGTCLGPDTQLGGVGVLRSALTLQVVPQ